jgi:hypothetical protein
LIFNNFALDLSFSFAAGLSIVISVLLNQYLAGAVVVLMLSGGESIEAYAIATAGRCARVSKWRFYFISSFGIILF